MSTKHLDKSPSALLHENVRQIKERTQKLQSEAKEAVRRMPVVLTEQQLKRLKEHKYASEGITLFDPFMQEFWKWLVQYCPLWVAPNLLTIVGLALNIGTSVILMIATNGAKEEVGSHLVVLLGQDTTCTMMSSSAHGGCTCLRRSASSSISHSMPSTVNRRVEPILPRHWVNFLIMVVILSLLVWERAEHRRTA